MIRRRSDRSGPPRRAWRPAPVVTGTLAVVVGGLMTSLVTSLVMVDSAAAQSTVYQCVRDGRTTFQQDPCPSGSRGEMLKPAVPNVLDPGPAPAPAAPAPSAPPAPPPPPAAATSPAPATSDEAQRCLEHLRRYLRDPRSAYVEEPRRDGRVLYLRVYAGLPQGGIGSKPAACEFVNGVIDASWTRTQLQRLGWLRPPHYLVPRNGPPGVPNRPRLIVVDDIEAPDSAER